jgi:hypothetical protein
MSSLNRPRVIWFLCLVVLALINVFVGRLIGEYARNIAFIVLIVTAAVSLVVLFAIDHRAPDRRSLAEHAEDVQRAMEAEEKQKQ